ncbi:hypothetical protein FVEG_16742 [Fusarium verticillioides 7600]|uniref:Uncharacterized protein n=1 Tax=Gibberella moniliformis (strain M3125 / FGSC 7600) TaxID=334819 RepID=W7MTS0_GIBM7|nr:hypothetical protein FVEG_16742 [Fusarium verticillioides 7600]EWG51085.1 hypothetical protein FVEG_16742 [Fusarium verticillioides 7600]
MRDIIPDVYQLGISGLCRINGTAEKTCTGHFPGALNLTEAVIQDIDNFKHCEPWRWNETLEQDCKDRIRVHVVDYNTAESLDHLLVAFLVLSIITNVASFYVIYRTGAVRHPYTTAILGLDMMLLFTSFALCFVVMSYEVGPYVEHVPLQKFSEIEMIGPGFWALLGILVMRMTTTPNLLIGIIPLLIPVSGVFGFLVHMKGFFTLVRTAVLTDISRLATT